jgi:hypothetical protein
MLKRKLTLCEVYVIFIDRKIIMNNKFEKNNMFIKYI